MLLLTVFVGNHLEGIVSRIFPLLIVGVQVFVAASVMHELHLACVDILEVAALVHDVVCSPDGIIGRLLLIG